MKREKQLPMECSDALEVANCDLQTIESLIHTIRGTQVILDRDLARLYNVETKVLNQAVKRNLQRFPARFRFQLSKEETNELVTNCDRFDMLKHSSVCPYVFTEQGVAMLSSVLRSMTAVETSIKIMDAFVAMRHLLASNAQLFQRLETIEYHQLEMKRHQDCTDNLLIIDDRVYHIGASIKDLGKKLFGFSLMLELTATELLSKIGIENPNKSITHNP